MIDRRFTAMIVLFWIVGITFWAVVAFVVYHFIAKFW